MQSDRRYRRAVTDTKCFVTLIDRVNRVLIRLSDRLTEFDRHIPLDELLLLCQMLSPFQCNLYRCMIFFRSVHRRDCVIFLVID